MVHVILGYSCSNTCNVPMHMSSLVNIVIAFINLGPRLFYLTSQDLLIFELFKQEIARYRGI